MIHRGTIYEGHAIFTKQLFLSLFNVATHPIPKVQDPSKQKTIQHVTSTSPCMRSWWAEGSRQHIAPSGRRWEDWSLHGASIDHRVPGARAVRGTAGKAARIWSNCPRHPLSTSRARLIHGAHAARRVALVATGSERGPASLVLVTTGPEFALARSGACTRTFKHTQRRDVVSAPDSPGYHCLPTNTRPRSRPGRRTPGCTMVRPPHRRIRPCRGSDPPPAALCGGVRAAVPRTARAPGTR